MSHILTNLATMLVIVTSFLPLTSPTTHYLAEVRIFVDRAGYNKWMNATGKSEHWELEREMNSTIYEVNQVFRTLERFRVYLQMEIEDIVIVDSDIVNSSNVQTNLYKAAKQFEQWLNRVYEDNPYDVALFFTGFDLPYAYGVVLDIGGACTSNGFGIVELHSAFADVVITAHELGHIFGVQHDGFGSSVRCAKDSGWISNADVNATHPNRFYFSSCAAENIRNYIANLTINGTNCLSTSSSRKDITGPRYASLVMTFDGICQRVLGPASYIAREKYSSYGDEVCLVVHCVVRTEGNMNIWKKVITPEGLECGKSKLCIRGRCVKASGGSPYISDTCPFGDQPEIKEGSQILTCSRMNSTKCLKWSQACCQTCPHYSWNPGNADPGTADDVCRRMVGPRSVMARGAYATYGDNLCAYLTCLTPNTDTHWYYYTAPDGMKCGKDKRCRNGQCVFSLHEDKSMTDSCPYGDQPFLEGNIDFKTCEAYTKRFGCNLSVKETCCGSCYGPGTADQVCQRLHGPESSMARYFMDTYGDNICSRLACLTDMKGIDVFHDHELHKAPDGMMCGKNKRCRNGKCLYSPTGDPDMSDVCPYGDQPWLGGGFQTTCQRFASKRGCGNVSPRWDSTCCKSCKIDRSGKGSDIREKRSYYVHSNLYSNIYACNISAQD